MILTFLGGVLVAALIMLGVFWILENVTTRKSNDTDHGEPF